MMRMKRDDAALRDVEPWRPVAVDGGTTSVEGVSVLPTFKFRPFGKIVINYLICLSAYY